MKTQFLSDDTGKKLSVVIPIKEYEQILMQLEELADIRLYDEAKNTKQSSIPAADAFKLVEAKRRRKS